MSSHRLSYNQLLRLHQGTFFPSQVQAGQVKPLPSEGMGFGQSLGRGIHSLPPEGSGIENLPGEGGFLEPEEAYILSATPELGDNKSSVDKILEKLQKQIVSL